MSAQQVLIEKTERFVKKFYVNRLIQGVLIGAALWIVFYLLVNALEYFSWFSSKVRLALFILLILGSLCVMTAYLVVPLVNLIRFRKKMSLEQAALLIGKFFPDIHDKLLNTLQLSDDLASDASNELLVATIEQRTAQLTPVRFTDAVDLKGNLRYLYVFLALLVLLLALVLFLCWILILRRLPRTALRGAANWALGITLMWLLAATLLMPLFDAHRNYRPMADSLSDALAPLPGGCIAFINSNPGLLGALDYFAGLRAAPLAAGDSTACRYLRTRNDRAPETLAPEWEEIWRYRFNGGRHLEYFRLYHQR